MCEHSLWSKKLSEMMLPFKFFKGKIYTDEFEFPAIETSVELLDLNTREYFSIPSTVYRFIVEHINVLSAGDETNGMINSYYYSIEHYNPSMNNGLVLDITIRLFGDTIYRKFRLVR